MKRTKEFSNKLVTSFFKIKLVLDAFLFIIINLIYSSYVVIQNNESCEGFSCLGSLIILILIEIIIFAFITPVISLILNKKKIFKNNNIDKNTFKKIKKQSLIKIILSYLIALIIILLLFFILNNLLKINLDQSVFFLLFGLFIFEELVAGIGTILCFIFVEFKEK